MDEHITCIIVLCSAKDVNRTREGLGKHHSACISSTDHNGRQFWVVAAAREDAGRFYFARGWSA